MHDAVRLENLFRIIGPIDNPQGGFCRVWSAQWVKRTINDPEKIALKILRPSLMFEPDVKRDGHYEQFAQEVRTLSKLQLLPQIVRIYDWGFISSEHIPKYIDESGLNLSSGEKLAKRMKYMDINISPEEKIFSLRHEGIDAYADTLRWAITNNWRPYIALELLESDFSLYNLVGSNSGKALTEINNVNRLTARETIDICEQYLQLLKYIHSLDVPIFNYDTKPAHAFWYRSDRKLRIIDWNHPMRNLRSGKDGYVQEDIELMFYDFIFPAITGLWPPFGAGKEYKTTRGAPPPFEYTYGGVRSFDLPGNISIDKSLLMIVENALIHRSYLSIDELVSGKEDKKGVLDVAWRLGREKFDNRVVRTTEKKKQINALVEKGLPLFVYAIQNPLLPNFKDSLLTALDYFKMADQLSECGDADAAWLKSKTQYILNTYRS